LLLKPEGEWEGKRRQASSALGMGYGHQIELLNSNVHSQSYLQSSRQVLNTIDHYKLH